LRLLFVKLRHIGDALLLTPTLAAVKKAIPRAEIWVVVRRGSEGILAGCPHIDVLRTAMIPEHGAARDAHRGNDAGLLRELRGAHFEHAFELGGGDRGRWLVALSGARGKTTSIAARRFPIGNFIRDIRDVSYTPAPDVFHDLYGHLPFLADEDFANFCAEFGARAARWADSSLAMILWGRLFWFGVEFPLIGTAAGRKIFGGGILSSRGESEWSLSTGPQVVAFDPRVIIDLDYKIDEYQKKLFCLSSAQELYSCLVEYEELIKNKVQAASLFQETAGPRTETFFSAGRI
jgi:hypothetical protein